MTTRALNRRVFLAAGAVVLASGGRSRAHNGTIHVSIENLAFVPANIEAAVGDRIEWTNRDPFDHTATVKGGWDIVIPAGQVATRIVQAGDTVEYYCRFHPNMTGTIEVK
jgi:plastocyanin